MIKVYKAIFHLNEEEKAGDVFRSVENLITDMESEGEEVEVEILANSSGVKAFRLDSEKNRKRIKSLIEKGVIIAICSNTLNKLNLSEEDIIKEASIVKSGVGELTRRQYNGWSYIKL